MSREISENPIPLYQIRPRFQIDTKYSLDEIHARINNSLKKDQATCRGSIYSHYVTLFIPEDDQHYWSPQLSLNIEELDIGTHIRGLYGPNPSIWTMFIFFYSFIGIAFLFVSIFGFSRMSLGESGWILWLLPILFIIFISIYISAYFGKKKGHDQMIILHLFLEQCLDIHFSEVYKN